MTDASKIVPARGDDTASNRLTLTLRARDPRLVALVRLLARQAADDYINAARTSRKTGPTQ